MKPQRLKPPAGYNDGEGGCLENSTDTD